MSIAYVLPRLKGKIRQNKLLIVKNSLLKAMPILESASIAEKNCFGGATEKSYDSPFRVRQLL
jgi:hypothetical protein